MSKDAERLEKLTGVLLAHAAMADARAVVPEQARHLDAAWCFARDSIQSEPRPSRAKANLSPLVAEPEPIELTDHDLGNVLAFREMVARGDLVPSTATNTPNSRRPVEDGADFAMTLTVDLFERLTGRRAARAMRWTPEGSFAVGRTLEFCRTIEAIYGSKLGIATDDRIRKTIKARGE